MSGILQIVFFISFSCWVQFILIYEFIPISNKKNLWKPKQRWNNHQTIFFCFLFSFFIKTNFSSENFLSFCKQDMKFKEFLNDLIFEITFLWILSTWKYFNNNKKRLKYIRSIWEIHFVALLWIMLIFLLILFL